MHAHIATSTCMHMLLNRSSASTSLYHVWATVMAGKILETLKNEGMTPCQNNKFGARCHIYLHPSLSMVVIPLVANLSVE